MGSCGYGQGKLVHATLPRKIVVRSSVGDRTESDTGRQGEHPKAFE